MALREKIGEGLVSLGKTVKEGRARDVLGRQCWLWALIGAVVIGVSLPTLLVCWNCGRTGVFGGWNDEGAVEPSLTSVAGDWVGLQIGATIFCGPGAVILGLFVYGSCKNAALKGSTLRSVVMLGMWIATGLAFLNVPGYGVTALLHEHVAMKVALLFAVAGASCGVWIAWQAWRATHPEETFWPRFSLGTLMIVVFAWGILLAVFAPK